LLDAGRELRAIDLIDNSIDPASIVLWCPTHSAKNTDWMGHPAL
jgi:hypothetical protein